jgi:outer membrane protein OmpA-like peptidoglycan-associated protein
VDPVVVQPKPTPPNPPTNTVKTPIATNTPPIKPPQTSQETTKTKSNPEPTKAAENPVDFTSIKRADFSKGQTLQVPNLMFPVNDTLLNSSSYPILDKLYNFLNKNPDLVIEVGGHTNGVCQDDYCNRLSEKRARAVADYLTKKGITSNRLKIKGYGKAMPISSVASDPRNQRVEIKIITFNNG